MADRLLGVALWQDDYGRAKDLGEIWRLRRGASVASCVLQGHPLGTEARILIDGHLQRTEAFRESAAMIEATWTWRAALEAKGWTQD